MVKVALLVRLEAKPGKEADVESFLRGGLSVVQEEPVTTTWYTIKLGPSTFDIFDTFPGVRVMKYKGSESHFSTTPEVIRL